MKCVVNKRTGPDLLCDDCRVNSLRERVLKLQKERDWLLDELVKESATVTHSSGSNSKSFEECLDTARFFLSEHLKSLHS